MAVIRTKALYYYLLSWRLLGRGAGMSGWPCPDYRVAARNAWGGSCRCHPFDNSCDVYV